ncbi:hypothetical protein ACFW05_30540, partial [Streptomyces albogriseolus]
MTDAMTADEFAQLERYTRFWNTGPGEERDRLASAVFTGEVEYRALVGFLRGAAALADFRDQFVSHVGPARVRRREEPEVHHGRARRRGGVRAPRRLGLRPPPPGGLCVEGGRGRAG